MGDYIGWIISAIVLGMVAYPILQIIPKPQQKLMIQLRQQAKALGLIVQVRQPALPTELRTSHHILTRCVAYFLEDVNRNITSTHLAVRGEKDNEWFWPNKNRPPVKYLDELLKSYQQLPDYIYAVEHNPSGHAIFWRENQTTEELQHIQSILQQYRSLFS